MTVLGRRALAVALLAAVLVGAWEYPVAKPYLLLAVIAYVVALHRSLSVALFVLPVLVPLLNLAPWSGRLLLEDLDLFVLATISMWLWHRSAPSMASVGRLGAILMSLLTLSFAIALVRGLLPLPPFDRTALSDYYSPFNSLRAGKGFLFALALTPLLRQQLTTPEAPGRRYLLWGATIGAFGNAIVILWERGIIRDLLHARNRYALVSSLLDFTTLYRVTALFSEMHTGGEALDGYLAIAWPCVLGFLLLYRHRPVVLAIGGLALVATSYGVLMTYTRTTYVAIAISLVTFAITLLLSSPGRRLPFGRLSEAAGLLIVTMGVAFYGFLRGGTVTLAASLLAFSAGAVISLASRRLPRVASAAAFAIAASFCVYAAARGMLRSRWVQTPLAESLLIALVVGVGLLGIGVWLQRRTSDIVRPQFLAMLLVVFVGGTALATQVIGGYRVRDRLSTIGTDMSTRTQHWQAVLDSMPRDAWTTALGMGLGRFPDAYRLSPQTYRQAHQLDRMEGYSILNDGTRTFVRFRSAPYLGLGQRITLQPNSPYRLSLEVRAGVPTYGAAVSLEYRNIILSEGYNPTRKNVPFAVEKSDGGWRRVEIPFDTGHLGREPWYERWPIIILIGERSFPTMDITNVALIDPAGRNVIQNGSFDRGGDHWFAYDDFDHLPWHVKNIGLATYFEQGVLGVAVFVVFVVFALVRGAQWARRDEALGPALTAAIVSMVTIGLAGNPLDAPRVAFLFYAVLLVVSGSRAPAPRAAAR
jgi:hypothetical protein